MINVGKESLKNYIYFIYFRLFLFHTIAYSEIVTFIYDTDYTLDSEASRMVRMAGIKMVKEFQFFCVLHYVVGVTFTYFPT